MYLRVDKLDSDISKANYTLLNNNYDTSLFGPIGNLNIFIGANNSGKSRFLRGLIKSDNLFFIKNLEIFNTLEKLEDLCNNIKFGFSDKIDSYTLPARTNWHPNLPISNYLLEKIYKLIDDFVKTNDFADSITFDSEYFKHIYSQIYSYYIDHDKDKFENKIRLIINQLTVLHNLYNIDSGEISRHLPGFYYNTGNISNEILIKITSTLNDLLKYTLENIKFTESIYIPILRSAISIRETSSTAIENTVAENYGIAANNQEIKIFTGQDLYNSIRKVRNSHKKERVGFEEFEKFLSKFFFQGKDLEIIALDGTKNINLLLDGDERDIHYVGDGIQSLIILLYPIFTAKDNSVIYIEEPEINLHPGMQRIFLEQLFKNEILKNKKLTYFITTHSNHLLDLSLELDESVSIYTFEKTKKDNRSIFHINNIKNKNNTALQLLGVNNSSVFMANCSIWVEGITDRYYIKSFLDAFYKEYESKRFYKEDINYTIFEYAGSNLSHYTFFDEVNPSDINLIKGQFINNNIYLISDQDKNKSKKHEKFYNQLSESFTYDCLKVREIENILSEKQLIKFLPLISGSFKKDQLEKCGLLQKNYKKEYLGNYLTTLKISAPKGLKAASGTFDSHYKLKLAKVALQKMEWKEMSQEAKALTERIYQFIKKANHFTE